MFSDLVQKSAHALGKALRTGFARAGLIMLSLSLTTTAQAVWQDPLNTPALATEKAHEALLLDVIRVDQRLVAVGGHGHIIYSDDQGASWTQASVPVSVTLTAVYFPSGDYGWAVGHDGVILHSTDGGKTWSKQFDGYKANEAMVEGARAKKAKAAARLEEAEANGDDIAIEDAEIALEDATFGLEDALYDLETGSTKPFLDVWFYDAKRGFAVGAYGMFFHTSDGGQSWQDASARLNNPQRLHINAISLVGPQSLTVAGEMGMLLRSDDLGETWSVQESPYDGSLFGIVAKGDKQLLFGLRGHVYESLDGGVVWNEIDTGSEQTVLSGVVGKEHTLLVGNAGSVVVFDQSLSQPEATTLEGRKGYAAAAETSDGHFVLVGEAGVMRLNAEAELINQTISMAAGDL